MNNTHPKNTAMLVDRPQHEPQLLPIALQFTAEHKNSIGLHPAVRELRCLETLFPGILLGPREDDSFAGRIHRPLAYLGNVHYPEGDDGDNCGYGYDKYKAERILGECFPGDALLTQQVNEMTAYWQTHSTYRAISDGMDEAMRSTLFTRKYCSESAVCHRLHRVASPSIDYRALLRLGVRGYQAKLSARMESTAEGSDRQFLQAACEYMDLFLRILRDYEVEYRTLAQTAKTEQPSKHLRIADALHALHEGPPENFFQAVQLMHLFTVTGFTSNAFGRLDDDLGPFLAEDLEKGTLSMEEATQLLVNLWQLMCEHYPNGRMTLGGLGRENPAQGDLFCQAALEATRIYYGTIQLRQGRAIGLPLSPQVAFRMSRETPQSLRDLALDVVASGATFPILYDDESNVPAVANAFRISEEEARQYTFFDCGEYLIHGRSIGTPSTIINLPKALEVALHDGIDPRTGKRVGSARTEGSQLDSFEAIWEAYTQQVEHAITQCARFQKHQFDRLGEDCSFLAMSLLMEDCVERGRHALNGGCAYLGGTLETYGNITVADSLYAIKRAVFDEKRITLEELMAHQDSDFIQNEALVEYLLELPKFGNDLDDVDAFAQRINDHVCTYTRAQAEPVGLHHFLVVVINNGANVSLGHHVNATADGRRSGMPVSNGHTPTPGRDTSGITALINSILKLSPMKHGGAVHNLRFSKQTMQERRDMVKALLKSYFTRGGTQCMVTVTSRQELEDALEHPENYGHLLVRVGGYSARFVELPKDIQMEIVNRNAY